MKKLKTTIPDGGSPLGQFPVIRDIFDIETKDAIEAMLSTVIIGETEGIILSGCLATGTAGNFAISSGYIFVDAKVLRYPGSSGNSATQFLKLGTVTEESGVFSDGVTRAFIDVEVATEFASSGGGGGTQFITLAFVTPGQTLADRMGDFINDGKVITAKIAASNVTLAKMAANSVDSPQYVDGSIDTVHLADGSVTADKITGLETAFANLTMLNSWTSITSAQFAKDSLGFVHIRATVDGSSQTSNIPFILPTGNRPLVLTHSYAIIGKDTGGLSTNYRVFIETDGEVHVSVTDGGTYTTPTDVSIFVSFFAG